MIKIDKNKLNISKSTNRNKPNDDFLKRKPTYKEIQNSSFLFDNTFEKEEIVLINRSRGGFSFGKIASIQNKDYCISNKEIKEHNTTLYRVVYLVNGEEDKKQFKDLPSIWIGKRMQDEMEEINSYQSNKEESLGDYASERQLNCSLFALENKYKIGEWILIADEERGFKNAMIEEEVEIECPFGNHSLTGYHISTGTKKLLVSSHQILKLSIEFGKKTSDKEKKKKSSEKTTNIIPLKNLTLTPKKKISVVKRENRTNVSSLVRGGPVVVIDAPNVAKNHGKNKSFSTVGLRIAIEHFEKKGFNVVALLPEHYLEDTNTDKSFPHGEDLNMLKELYSQNKVFTCPKGDYDDSYTIKYAQMKKGVIVTNDRFKDYSEKNPKMAGWIYSHCLHFLFVGDDFIPNPDFVWPKN